MITGINSTTNTNITGNNSSDFSRIPSSSRPKSTTNNGEASQTKPTVDTSRIDRQIKELKEKLSKAEMREAKEHNTSTAISIQHLKNTIQDLENYRNSMLRGN